MQVFKIDEKNIRIVYGKMLNDLTLDWTVRDLNALKTQLDFALSYKDQLPSLKKSKYKNLKIHEGANHLDIIDYNVGSLNLLTIEDHFFNR